MIRSIATYLKGVTAEFSKVVWPTKAQFGRSFMVVVIGVAICAALVSSLDYGLSLIIKAIINA